MVFNPCPADGYTKRQEVKELIHSLSKEYPDLREKVFSAMQRLPLPAWEPQDHRAAAAGGRWERGIKNGRLPRWAGVRFYLWRSAAPGQALRQVS